MNPKRQTTVPVYRAALPRAERLLPYLAAMDESRWYSNRGELVVALEQRLAELLCDGIAKVTTAANGTAAIEGAILATAGRATPDRPRALLPAYTFIATVSAVERCGYTPYLVDIDSATWALDANKLLDHPMLSRTGVVVTVAPYGRFVPQAPWVDFYARTNVPVVIDAAAAFESTAADPRRSTGTIPVTLSFQATKAFSSGEGGCVVWSDEEGLSRVIKALNFGILNKRESTSSGLNGKMSEYHAAVGLASLDSWPETCAANRDIVSAYRAAARAHGFSEQLILAPDVASNYALLDAAAPETADEVVAALQAANIESRRWYGRGLHREPYLLDVERDPLPATERIAQSVIGLPIAPDLAASDIERTVAAVASVLRSDR